MSSTLSRSTHPFFSVAIFCSKSPKSGYWFLLGFLHPEWNTTMTQPTSQTFFSISSTWLYQQSRTVTTTKNPRVMFFPGVAPFSINGSLPWLGADGNFCVFFVCVESTLHSASARRRGVTFVCYFFCKECHRPDLCGCFFVESLRYWRNYTLSFLIGIIFLGVKTTVSFF